MAENGEEKLLAVARHIAKTLGQTNNNMADDILQIFSNFDGRFSKEKLSDEGVRNDTVRCAALEQTVNSLDRQISDHLSSENSVCCNSTAFLSTVDELVSTIEDWSPLSDDKVVGACLQRADDILQQAMFRAEEEFR
ncbi:exocyst complex component EXO70B1-like, partial [Trifolium medium]|nr:exocyst complex component EXO70B1-like [Trifolium medium]